MLATFILYFTRSSVGFYLRNHLFSGLRRKNCCFSTFAQYNRKLGQSNKV